MMRYVITGGPGVGKTTTLQELEKLGYAVVPESARSIILEQQRLGKGILPWTDLVGFQELVLQRQLELEDRVNAGIAYCDRGIVDQVAYCRLGSVGIPRTLEDALRVRRYDGVFLLDPLPFYEKDAQRREDRETGLRLHDLIGESYCKAGYRVNRIPVLPPHERALHIIELTTKNSQPLLRSTA